MVKELVCKNRIEDSVKRIPYHLISLSYIRRTLSFTKKYIEVGRGPWNQSYRGAPLLTQLLFAYIVFCFARPKREKLELYLIPSTNTRSYQVMVSTWKNQRSILVEKQVLKWRNKYKEFLKVAKSVRSNKYLGLPSITGRKNNIIFNYIWDHIMKRVQSQSRKHLSKADRKVIIKHVAQSILTYVKFFLVGFEHKQQKRYKLVELG